VPAVPALGVPEPVPTPPAAPAAPRLPPLPPLPPAVLEAVRTGALAGDTLDDLAKNYLAGVFNAVQRGDTLNKNLPKPIPGFGPNTPLQKMRDVTGKTSEAGVRRAAARALSRRDPVAGFRWAR